MHTLNDEFSGRPVAADAWKGLKPFRDGGSVSFHNFEPQEVRPKYVASSQANGLSEVKDPETTDYQVEDFQVRVYEPRESNERDAATPVVLFIHGGGWLMGNLETHHSGARRLAVQTGFPVIAVDYRLAPEHLYPAAIDDCRTALRWLRDGKDAHGIEVENVCVLGDSAGGQLAAILANEFTGDDSVPELSSQVLLYPITDCSTERTEGGDSYKRIENGFPLVADTMRWFIDTYLPEGQDRTVADLSPLLHELPEGLPPALVITVDNDPLMDEGAEYAAKLAKAGVDVEYKHLLGYHHGLFTSAGVIERGEEEYAAIARYIVKHAS